MTQSYLDLVRDLQNQIVNLQTSLSSQDEPAIALVKNWQRSQQEIQTFFQTKIVNTDLEVTPQNLSLQVEIDKQLKMLGVDLTMLQTARNPTTWQKRHQQACDRLIRLQRYCD